jgi:hypothetical protein
MSSYDASTGENQNLIQTNSSSNIVSTVRVVVLLIFAIDIVVAHSYMRVCKNIPSELPDPTSSFFNRLTSSLEPVDFTSPLFSGFFDTCVLKWEHILFSSLSGLLSS